MGDNVRARWTAVIVLAVGFGVVAPSLFGTTPDRHEAQPTTPVSGHSGPPSWRFPPNTPVAQYGSKKSGIEFWHTSAWTEYHYEWRASFSEPVVYLANVRLHDPCTRRVTPNGGYVQCGDPVGSLPSGGVLVTWENVGLPRPGPEVPDADITLSGLPAHVAVARPGLCSRLGATETIVADIARPHGNHYEMIACFVGHEAANERLVHGMLDSLIITQ